jgi:hypothetical protein
MNRNLAPLAGTLYRGVKVLVGRLDITASTGAVAATSVFVGGASTPFARSSAGVYTLTLADNFVGPAFAFVTMKKASADPISAEISAEDLVGASATKVLTIRTRIADGTATDSAVAASVYVWIVIPDSQAN